MLTNLSCLQLQPINRSLLLVFQLFCSDLDLSALSNSNLTSLLSHLQWPLHFSVHHQVHFYHKEFLCNLFIFQHFIHYWPVHPLYSLSSYDSAPFNKPCFDFPISWICPSIYVQYFFIHLSIILLWSAFISYLCPCEGLILSCSHHLEHWSIFCRLISLIFLSWPGLLSYSHFTSHYFLCSINHFLL